MATFPHSLCGIRFGDHAEQEDTAFLRSEVERGLPRQRRFQADTRVSVPCTLLFNSRANADAWRTWVGADGGGWFDFTLPRTGAVVQARVLGGNLGTLKPRSPDWEWSERSIVLEYIRPNFIQLPPGLHSVDPARILSVQRNSAATSVDDAGVLQTAAANVARWQGGQLLVEGAGTNLLRWSNVFDYRDFGWERNECVAVPESAIGPYGENSANLITFSGKDPFILQRLDFSAGTQYTLIFWISGVAGTVGNNFQPMLWYLDGNPGAANQFGTEQALKADGDWYLWTFTAPFTASAAIRIDLDNSGSSVQIGNQVAIACVDLKAGDSSSYIPTTTAPVTRAADIITVAA